MIKSIDSIKKSIDSIKKSLRKYVHSDNFFLKLISRFSLFSIHTIRALIVLLIVIIVLVGGVLVIYGPLFLATEKNTLYWLFLYIPHFIVNAYYVGGKL